MQPDEKKKLVEKLVDLTVKDTLCESDMSTSIGYALANRMRQKIREEQINIRLKHLEPEQIRALLDFYDTAIGKSILASQSKIDVEVSSCMARISAEVHQQVIEDIQAGVLPSKSSDAGHPNN